MSIQAILTNNNDNDYIIGGQKGQIWSKKSDQDGDAGWQDLPTYDGVYQIIPQINASITMKTSQTYLDRDIEISQVPIYKTANNAGGNTIIIGG